MPEDYASNTSQELIVEAKTSDSGANRVADAVAIPNGEADVWDPNALYGLGATNYLDIELEAVNVDGTNDVDIDIGVDYGDTGASDRYFLFEYTLRAGSIPIRLGPYRIGGDDVIRANATAANDAELHIYIIREGDAA